MTDGLCLCFCVFQHNFWGYELRAFADITGFNLSLEKVLVKVLFVCIFILIWALFLCMLLELTELVQRTSPPQAQRQEMHDALRKASNAPVPRKDGTGNALVTALRQLKAAIAEKGGQDAAAAVERMSEILLKNEEACQKGRQRRMCSSIVDVFRAVPFCISLRDLSVRTYCI